MDIEAKLGHFFNFSSHQLWSRSWSKKFPVAKPAVQSSFKETKKMIIGLTKIKGYQLLSPLYLNFPCMCVVFTIVFNKIHKSVLILQLGKEKSSANNEIETCNDNITMVME